VTLISTWTSKHALVKIKTFKLQISIFFEFPASKNGNPWLLDFAVSISTLYDTAMPCNWQKGWLQGLCLIINCVGCVFVLHTCPKLAAIVSTVVMLQTDKPYSDMHAW